MQSTNTQKDQNVALLRKIIVNTLMSKLYETRASGELLILIECHVQE